jgi:hypothetical protein
MGSTIQNALPIIELFLVPPIATTMPLDLDSMRNSWLPMANWKGWTDAKYQNSHKEVCISPSPNRPNLFPVPRMLFRLDHQPAQKVYGRCDGWNWRKDSLFLSF